MMMMMHQKVSSRGPTTIMMRIMRTKSKGKGGLDCCPSLWEKRVNLFEVLYIVLEDYFLSKPRYSYSSPPRGEEERRARDKKKGVSKFCSYFVNNKRERRRLAVLASNLSVGQ